MNFIAYNLSNNTSMTMRGMDPAKVAKSDKVLMKKLTRQIETNSMKEFAAELERNIAALSKPVKHYADGVWCVVKQIDAPSNGGRIVGKGEEPTDDDRDDDDDLDCLMWKAVEAENTDAVLLLLKAGAHVDGGCVSPDFPSPGRVPPNRFRHSLELAAILNNPYLVEILLAHGAEKRCGPGADGCDIEPDSQDHTEGPFIHDVVARGDLEHYKLLIDAGFSTNCTSCMDKPLSRTARAAAKKHTGHLRKKLLDLADELEADE